MPTVSDLLAIQLSIDTSGVNRGGDEATSEIDRIKQRLQQRGDEIERFANAIAASVNRALFRVAELMGLVLSFEGFRRLTVEWANAGTALGRFSEAVEVSAGRIGALEQALERAGGVAGDVRPLLATMRSDITKARLGQEAAPWMRTLGLAPFNFGVTELMRRSPEETLLEISRRAGAAHITPTQLQAFMGGLPLSPETLAVLTNPERLQSLLRKIEEDRTAPTPEQVGAAERLKEKFATLEQLSESTIRDLITLAEPFISAALNWGIRVLEWLDNAERTLLGTSLLPPGRAWEPRHFGRRPWSEPSVPSAPSVPGGGRETLGDRLNNPGNLKWGPFAKEHGATGPGPGGHAVFPDYATGRAAMESLLRTKGAGQTIAEIGKWYTEDPNWAAGVARSMGVTPDYRPSSDEVSKFADAIQRQEGTGGRAPPGQPRPDQSQRPYHYRGTLEMEGEKFSFGTGGAGRGSIPYGDYPVTPNTIGPWGQAHGAVGLNYNRIWDPQLRSFRDGIELHSGSSDALITEGCVAIAGRQWPQFKAHVLDMIRRYGRVTLHVGPEGASVVPTARFATPKPDIPDVNTGAGAAMQEPRVENRTINNDTTAVVNHVTVNTNATNAASIAADVKEELGRQLSMPQLERTE